MSVITINLLWQKSHWLDSGDAEFTTLTNLDNLPSVSVQDRNLTFLIPVAPYGELRQ